MPTSSLRQRVSERSGFDDIHHPANKQRLTVVLVEPIIFVVPHESYSISSIGHKRTRGLLRHMPSQCHRGRTARPDGPAARGRTIAVRVENRETGGGDGTATAERQNRQPNSSDLRVPRGEANRLPD